MKKPNFEATFRRLLDTHESTVREHQMETFADYKEAYAADVKRSREKIVAMFRHTEQQGQRYREVLEKVLNESMDPPVQQFVREALYGKKKVRKNVGSSSAVRHR